MALSFAQKLLRSERPVVLFHTWTVTRELLGQAIREKRSMDLDVCVDDRGDPYLGHPKEYHEKTREPFFGSMPLWEAVEALADSNIPVIGFSSELVRSGALVGLSVNYEDVGRQAALLTRKILSAQIKAPITFPPEKLRLALNLKTAKFLGLQIPSDALNRADQLY